MTTPEQYLKDITVAGGPLTDLDQVLGNIDPGGTDLTRLLTLALLRVGLSNAAQDFKGNVDVAGYLKATGNLSSKGFVETATSVILAITDSLASLGVDLDLQNKLTIRNQSLLDINPFQYYSFDGVNDGVLLGTSLTLNFDTGAFYQTVFKINQTTGTVIIAGWTGASGRSFIYYDFTTGKLSCESSTNADFLLEYTYTPDDQWHNLLITGSGLSVKSYLDGKLISTETIIDGGLVLNTFGYNGASVNFTNYCLGLVRAGNRELTSAEAIQYSSNPWTPIKASDYGGSNVNLMTGNAVNFAVDAANKTAFDAAYTGLGITTYGTPTSIATLSGVLTINNNTVTAGVKYTIGARKRFRIIFNVSAITNTWKIAKFSGGFITIDTITSTGLKVIEGFNDTSDISIYLLPNAAVVSEISIDASAVDNENQVLGVTYQLLPQDMQSDYAFDSSRNNNNGAVSSVSVIGSSRNLTPKKGTFTATLTCGTSGTITLNTSFDTLNYRREGMMFEVWGQIKITSVSSPVGRLILNTPYTLTDTAETSELAAGSVTTQTLASGITGGLGFIVNAGTKTIDICDGFNGTGAVGNDFAAHIQANTLITVFFRGYTLDPM